MFIIIQYIIICTHISRRSLIRTTQLHFVLFAYKLCSEGFALFRNKDNIQPATISWHSRGKREFTLTRRESINKGWEPSDGSTCVYTRGSATLYNPRCARGIATHERNLNCRYIAVTQPIKYAKHKNNRRVWLTILLVWAISAAIGSPIVLGLNNTPNRIPDLCLFYNTDFIIYSSLSSFYIPCIIMVFLYYNIFKVRAIVFIAIARKSIIV